MRTAELIESTDLRDKLPEIGERLDYALRDRDRGFLSERDFESRMNEIERLLGPDRRLEQPDLCRRGTRFQIRNCVTGDLIGSFEYWRRSPAG